MLAHRLRRPLLLGAVLLPAIALLPASPASAATGSWSEGVLTVSADHGDDLTVRAHVRSFKDQSPAWVDVAAPGVDLSATCTKVERDNAFGDYWHCVGDPNHLVVEGGDGRTDVIAQSALPGVTTQILAGKEGSRIEVQTDALELTGRGGVDRLRSFSGEVRADLAGGDDRALVTNAFTARLQAGKGRDVLAVAQVQQPDTDSRLVARASGGAGDDVLVAVGQAVRLYGGDGDDRLYPDATDVSAWWPDSNWVTNGAGPNVGDLVDGGEGRDTVVLNTAPNGARVRVTLDGLANDGQPDESDHYVGVENVVVLHRVAVVDGNARPNTITLRSGGTARGLGGDDLLRGGWRLVGGAGHDVLRGGRDTLVIRAADGERDVISCASPDTVVRADAVDEVSASCGHVLR